VLVIGLDLLSFEFWSQSSASTTTYPCSCLVRFVFVFLLLLSIIIDPILVVTWSEFQKVSAGRKEEGRAKKSLETPPKKNSAYTVFMLLGSFWAIRHYSGKKLASARFPEQFSEISKKISWAYPDIPPCWLFWDTFHPSDFRLIRALFRALLPVAFWCRSVPHGVLGSRLSWDSLGPAQYRRWAVIQPCIAVLKLLL
jgi:hypothetical protein